MIRVGWIPGEFNKSDLLTKTTMPGNKKNGFVQQIFHNKATVIRREDLDIVLELAQVSIKSRTIYLGTSHTCYGAGAESELEITITNLGLY